MSATDRQLEQLQQRRLQLEGDRSSVQRETEVCNITRIICTVM